MRSAALRLAVAVAVISLFSLTIGFVKHSSLAALDQVRLNDFVSDADLYNCDLYQRGGVPQDPMFSPAVCDNIPRAKTEQDAYYAAQSAAGNFIGFGFGGLLLAFLLAVPLRPPLDRYLAARFGIAQSANPPDSTGPA